MLLFKRGNMTVDSLHIRGACDVPLDLLAEHAREIRSEVRSP